MDTPTLAGRIQDLKNQTIPYGFNKSKRGLSLLSSLNANKTYIATPIAVAIALLLFRPRFVCMEEATSSGDIEYKISIRKLVLSTTILTFGLVIGLYMYNYQPVQN